MLMLENKIFKMKKIFVLFVLGIFAFGCEKDGVTAKQLQKIEDYITSNKLVVTETTPSGLKYIRTKESTGASLKNGQTVTVKYAGEFLSGKQFDEGTFPFLLGSGQVIQGFDEGILKMKVGESATLIMPSDIAYGSQKTGSIPKNSPLVFKIEVLSAK
jgi:FKBP-type peptidyl-prolyl cis-trans isomerase